MHAVALALATTVVPLGCGDDTDAAPTTSTETGTTADDPDTTGTTGASSTGGSSLDDGSSGSGGSSDSTAEMPAAPLDGFWQTQGYGWIYAVDGDDVQLFEVTSGTCVQLVSGTITAHAPDPQTAARMDVAVPGLFTLGMSVTEGDAGTLHFFADGLVISPPANPVPALPDRCLNPGPADDLAAFDTMTAWFDEHYALFADRDVDWEELVALHRPRLVGPEPEPFLDVASELLEPLQDAHVSLFGPEGGFEGRREEANAVTEKMVEQGQGLISSDYLVTARDAYVGGQLEFARLPGDIGYLATHGFGPLVSEDGRIDYLSGLAEVEAALDEIFAGPPMNGLVLDLRTNGGGSDLYGMAIASRLTQAPYTAYTIRARVDAEDAAVYSEGVPVEIAAAEGPGFDGSVAVLIGRDTVSAGETVALALRGRPAVTLYGEPTQGAFSAVLNHFLPNGWMLGLPNEHYVTEAGDRFDVVGIPPDVLTPVFSAEDLSANRDSALDAALAALTG